MRARRWLSLLVVPLALAMQVSVALASDGWCDTDPVLVIQTPAGNLVPVYVTVGAQSVAFTPNTLLGSLILSYTATPTSDGKATRVSVVINVPPSLLNQAFATRYVISSEALATGMVYASGSSVSGKPATSTFQLAYR